MGLPIRFSTMGINNQASTKNLNHHHFSTTTIFFTKKFLPWSLYAIFPFLLLHFCFHSYPFYLSIGSSLSPPPPPLPLEQEAVLLQRSDKIETIQRKNDKIVRIETQSSCDYTNGEWVDDKMGPIYNGTTCGIIKEGQNCILHGRQDLDYLYWRWQPSQCNLPRFDPNSFLQLLTNKHLAFVGDSMARNQLESLLCMLSTISTPKLVHSYNNNKFRKWYFGSHNLSVSSFWSPFLVQGEEKSSNGSNFNRLYLDKVDRKWGDEIDRIDMVVMSIGHWFLHPAVYYNDGKVLGCHYCPGQNHTEVGFYDVLRKALKTTFKSVTERKTGNDKGIDVILTTFSPSHFEGDWDKFGACSKTKPYKENEILLQGMDKEIREIEIEEVEIAKGFVRARQSEQRGQRTSPSKQVRIEALDVTKLALMRGDGHPGPYMHPFPFANGVSEHVQNDCVHWCLPGPIDTWNEILLEVIKKWAH